jgi:hypothetical protein
LGQVAEIPIGFDGLTGSKNASQVLPGELTRAQSVEYPAGTLQKEGGATKYNSTAIAGAPAVIGGWDWHPSEGIQRMIVLTSAGALLRDDGAATFPTTLTSGLTVADVVPVFVEGGTEAAANARKLFLFTGVNPVQVLAGDGATTAALATPPADWAAAAQPTFGFMHAGRLTGGGNSSDPHRWYLSSPTNHEDFTTTPLQFAIFPGEGEKLVAGWSFGALAVLWKAPRGIYVVNTADPDSDNWTVSRLTDATGLLSPLGFTIIDTDLLYLDQGANFQLLSAVDTFTDVTSRNLGQQALMAEFFRTTLHYGGLEDCRAIWYSAKRQALFSVRQLGSSQNDAKLIVDFNRPDRPRWHYSPRDVVRALWLRRDINGIPRPMAGDASGFVWHLDQMTRSKDGAGYEGAFTSAQLDFSTTDPKFGTIRKAGDFLELVVEPKGNWDLAVDVLWDGAVKQTLQFNMGVTGATLGTFILDTDRLADEQVLNKKRRIVGSGRRFAIAGRNSGAGEDFSIARFFLHFRPQDERLP